MKGHYNQPTSSTTITERLDLSSALQAADMGVWKVEPATNQITWDDHCSELFGFAKYNQLSYRHAIQFIHPEDQERVSRAVKWSLNPTSGGAFNQTFRTLNAEDGKLRWVQFKGRSYFSNTGELSRFTGIAQEVTHQVETQQHEATLRKEAQRQQRIYEAITASTPDLIYVFDLSYRFTYVNQALLNMWGSSWEKSIGKGLLENGYEPWHAQMHEREIDQVVMTRQLIRGEVSFPHATLGKRIYDYVFAPVFNEKGEVEAIAGTTRDITQQTISRLALQEAESNLRGAVELAQLGTWSIDVATQRLIFSDRLIEWFGYDPGAQVYQEVIPILEGGDQERVDRAVAWALNPESDGIYNEIYTVVHPKTGQKRILHARGKTVFDGDGKAVRLNGTAQDITLQRKMQLALEQQVQQRTEELAAANEELNAINEELATNNEEYIAINKELQEANFLLNRSNENLQQFAYVASHDLQEPLRKIQQFGDLLKTHYAEAGSEGSAYIERMQSAAARMSVLIRDLLDLSRISTQRDASSPVPLQTVVENALSTLELRVEELRARIEVSLLPTVVGDASQLNRLFQNLLSNALKFHRPGIDPVIRVETRLLAADQLPPEIRPSRASTAYHQIAVIDNGIGFDEKYVDRIFQVFQRLHGKSAYAGTGIGLAICEKVVANHGGAITAHSQPGQGATFLTYLPA